MLKSSLKVLCLLFCIAGMIWAQEATPDVPLSSLRGSSQTGTEGKGGLGPCVASCCIGPRVGLEMNEGVDIYQSEWIALGGALVGGSASGVGAPIGSMISVATRAYMAYEMGAKPNGLEGALASYFLGPRVGNELDTRKIRTMEWLRLVPCVNIYAGLMISLEAYNGKTMSEIEVKESLRR